MSNKTKKQKQVSVDTLEVGAYHLLHAIGTDGKPYLKVRTTSRNFEIKWDMTTNMYAILIRLWSDKQTDSISTLLGLFYQVCNIAPDAQMLNDWIALLQSYIMRNAKDTPDLTEEEELTLRHMINIQTDANALDEMFDRAQKEIENLPSDMTEPTPEREV